MRAAQPIFARPSKRLFASSIDIAIVTCCGWFFANIATLEWYPYEVLAWTLPVAYFVYDFVCLRSLDGASLGKRLFDIQVVSATTTPTLTAWQIAVRPASRVAMYLALVTAIQPAGPRYLDLAIVPFCLETALLFTPLSVTLADLIACTRVVNTPPPQPHRAPAAPMYSATDAEFGYPPRRKP